MREIIHIAREVFDDDFEQETLQFKQIICCNLYYYSNLLTDKHKHQNIKYIHFRFQKTLIALPIFSHWALGFKIDKNNQR